MRFEFTMCGSDEDASDGSVSMSFDADQCVVVAMRFIRFLRAIGFSENSIRKFLLDALVEEQLVSEDSDIRYVDDKFSYYMDHGTGTDNASPA